MNRGCIAVGEIACDNCRRLIEAGQRYLVMDEDGKEFHFCVECAAAKGIAAYIKEKGEEVLSFFPAIIEPIIITPPIEENQAPPPKGRGHKPEAKK